MLSVRLSDRLRLLQWALPIAIAFVALIYQFGPARLVHERFGEWAHYALEIMFYGTAGPTVTWLTLRVVRTWVEQKESAEAEVYRLNAELQARVEERTRELQEKAEALSRANADLQQLDQMKSEFVSLVSHEFRAPLTNMRGALELMGDTCPAVNTTCTRMVGIVHEQTSRLGRMVEDVLNVSRIETGDLMLEPEAVDFERSRDQVLAEFAARDHGHRFRKAEGRPGLRLWADPDRLHEILANLIDNAVKYSPRGTEIVITGEAWETTAVISVVDSGPGIPSQERSQIFEKFHRIDAGDSKETYGYGLGLYLCRRLVEAMEGRIWVESGRGHGSMFRFELPLAPEGVAVVPVG